MNKVILKPKAGLSVMDISGPVPAPLPEEGRAVEMTSSGDAGSPRARWK